MGRIRASFAALVVLAVALARLYLGVHYLPDVVGAAVLGIALVWVYHLGWSRYAGYLQSATFGVYAAMGLAVIAGVAGAILLGLLGSSPYRWHAGGLVLGVVAAFLLEYRYVRYAPGGFGFRAALAKLCIGLLPILILTWYDRVTGEDDLRLGAALVACGALWALLVAPATFAGFRMGRREIRR